MQTIISVHGAGWIKLAFLLIATIPGALPLVAAETELSTPIADKVSWPTATQTSRPWTRWWWHGSAVDDNNLSRLLEEYQKVGLGGVEITCIYGVKGNEERNREYRSDEWVDAVQHTLSEAKRLGMGVDLPAGSGWRMGGPGVTQEDANNRLELDKTKVAGGKTFHRAFDRSTLQKAIAQNAEGRQIDITNRGSTNEIQWEAPEGDWTVYTLAYRWAGDRVKRPGPGGEGLNINPYSKKSVSNFLEQFGKTLDRLPGVRAQFHDSFEYEGDWQPNFLQEFADRRGYRLEQFLPALAGDGQSDTVARVKCDYRETLSDMVLENLVVPWVNWAHEHGQLSRNQSHGSPANWLDLYAACDIPETESFGRLHGDDADQLVLKFASSAANVAGHPLVSAESATWLNEHFQTTLAQVKQIIDRQILAGVNHIFYHGTAYSPEDAEWPGWLFYASTQLNPQNPIWRDFSTLNTYVTRCQSVLQNSKPSNDVLLYWPIHDAWQNTKGLRMEIRVHNGGDWFYGRPLGDAAKILHENGFAFDYVSDRGLATSRPDGAGQLQTRGGNYDVVVVPQTHFMPLATLKKLVDFIEAGSKVVFWGELPDSPPGMKGKINNKEWKIAIQRVREAIAKGQSFAGDDLIETLQQAKVRSESDLTRHGIDFLRKSWERDVIYYLKNNNETSIDEWVSIGSDFSSAIFMDPLSGKIGLAETRSGNTGYSAVHLQLASGQTIFVRASAEQTFTNETWSYQKASGEAVELHGPWLTEFIAGGPELPEQFETPHPMAWTEVSDDAAKNFAGTATYSTELDCPNSKGRSLLDLGVVHGSARVFVNDKYIATLLAPPYVLELSNLQDTGNRLEIEVTGVAANRIRDLDRRGVEWRIFDDINLVNIDYKPFDATNWPIVPQGLAGPVTLTPLITTNEPTK
ncbi:glycosyl hydrolase [Bythopirellula goksoeyrii]|uniref:glycosyl hydrolase n=1 Tax=Bythopirellula goksoeyrii TaxID=1400387 RepID=UPI00143CE3BA|nr:glycosyl hydrolase [Bythopirellula goksoeyrii]